MLIMTLIVLLFVIVVNNSSVANDPTDSLVDAVMANASKLVYSDGTFSWNNIDLYKRGVYCSVYSIDGTELVGAFPSEEHFTLDFRSGMVRSITVDGAKYLVFDIYTDYEGGGVWIRGIISPYDQSEIIKELLALTYTLLPVLIVFSIVGGWLVACSAFRPVEKIVNSADSISSGSDLSARIKLKRGPSEMKHLAAAFNRMLERLEQSFEAEKNFTSAASHELRTPITVILAECDRAKRKCSTKEDFLESVNAIEYQSRNMGELVQQMLSLSRLQYGAEKYPMRVSSLSEFIDACTDEFFIDNDKSITIRKEIAPDVSAKYNPDLFSRVIMNLLQNAYKYGNENGNITVKLSADKAKNYAVLCVQDDGIGISEENLDKIWLRFWQADPSRGVSGGSGLGLALVKEITDLHNGTVAVESTEGVGSTFTVSIPMK